MLSFIFEIEGQDKISIPVTDHKLVEHIANSLAKELDIGLENINIRIA